MRQSFPTYFKYYANICKNNHHINGQTMQVSHCMLVPHTEPFCSDQCGTFPPSVWIKCQALYHGSAYIFSFTHLTQHLRWLNLVQGHISSTVVTVGCMSQLVIVQSVCAGSISWTMGLMILCPQCVQDPFCEWWGGYFVFAKCAGPILWMMGWMFHVCSVCRTHFVNDGVDVSCLQYLQDPFCEWWGGCFMFAMCAGPIWWEAGVLWLPVHPAAAGGAEGNAQPAGLWLLWCGWTLRLWHRGQWWKKLTLTVSNTDLCLDDIQVW